MSHADLAYQVRVKRCAAAQAHLTAAHRLLDVLAAATDPWERSATGLEADIELELARAQLQAARRSEAP